MSRPPTSTSYNFPSTSTLPTRVLPTASRLRRQQPIFKATPSVNSITASKALRRALVSELSTAGFSGAAEDGVLDRLEREVVGRIEQVYSRTHEYANLANRAAPIATDLLRACKEVEPSLVEKPSGKRKRRKGLSSYL